MPSGTPEERRQVPWGDVIYRAVLMSFAAGAFAFALNISVQLATVDQSLIAHLTTHPDEGLTTRIDRMSLRCDARYRMLEERVRELERHEHEGR